MGKKKKKEQKVNKTKKIKTVTKNGTRFDNTYMCIRISFTRLELLKDVNLLIRLTLPVMS